MNLNKIGVQYLKGVSNPRCKNRNGEEHLNSKGLLFIIIEYINANNCIIQFEDNTIIKNVEYSKIKTGEVKNPN